MTSPAASNPIDQLLNNTLESRPRGGDFKG